MAGLTDEGFKVKRFPDILGQMRRNASSIFADLVEQGDEVNTSPSSILGRLIALVAPSIAELWESLQDVWASFDPSQATGESLRIIGEYKGLTPLSASKSRVTLEVGGAPNTTITKGSVVRDVNRQDWVIDSDTTLSTTRVNRVGVVPISYAIGSEYSITLTFSGGSITTTVENTVSDNVNEVLALIASYINSENGLYARVGDGEVVVGLEDIYTPFSFTLQGLDRGNIFNVVEATAVDEGAIEADTGEVDSISTPILGWNSVHNPYPAVVGREEETDEEFRLRFKQSQGVNSSGFQVSIVSNIRALQGVEQVILYENFTPLVDDKGVPPHSFEVVVDGGNASQIGDVIFHRRPMGIGSSGNTEVEVNYNNATYIEKFSRPIPVPIYIEMDLVPLGEWGEESTEDIKNALIKHFQDDINIGSEVMYSRLFTPINSVPNHKLTSLKVGKSENDLGYQDVEVSYREIAVLPKANIIINVDY